MVLGNVLDDKDKDRLIKSIPSSLSKRIILWDYIDLEQRVDSNSKPMEYFENPKKAIVEEIINSFSAEKQKEKQRELIEALSQVYAKEELVLFLGAGVSIDAGIPSWRDLVKRLLINMIQKS